MILKNFKFVIEKTHLFLQNKFTKLQILQNFERFDNSYYASHILRQIGYNLVKKNSRSVT